MMTEISTIYIMISRKQYWYNNNDRYLWLEIMIDNYGWFIVDYGWFIVDYGWLLVDSWLINGWLTD